MAAYLFQKMLADKGMRNVKVDSAGIAPAEGIKFPAEARNLLQNEGVNVNAHTPQGITKELMTFSDRILVMESMHKRRLDDQYPQFSDKVHILKEYVALKDFYNGIRDPYGHGPSVYEDVFGQIKKCLRKLIDKIKTT
jgi:protein-tyrosine phosphatase